MCVSHSRVQPPFWRGVTCPLGCSSFSGKPSAHGVAQQVGKGAGQWGSGEGRLIKSLVIKKKPTKTTPNHACYRVTFSGQFSLPSPCSPFFVSRWHGVTVRRFVPFIHFGLVLGLFSSPLTEVISAASTCQRAGSRASPHPHWPPQAHGSFRREMETSSQPQLKTFAIHAPHLATAC